MGWHDGSIWVTLPSESKEAYAKLTAGLTPRPARTLPGIGDQWIATSLLLDRKKCLVRIRRSSALQAFACTPLIIINRRQIVVARHIIQENRNCFAATLEAQGELRIRFREGFRR